MLDLLRTYYPTHTEGEILLPDGNTIYTLELPWKDNLPFISCVSEGRYIVDRDHSGKHQWYKIREGQIEGRSSIELHEATRVDHLEGCIAPCMRVTNGKAYGCQEALEKLLELFGESSWVLNIKSKEAN